MLVTMASADTMVWSELPTDAGGPTPARAPSTQERFPAADTGYLAWSQVVGQKQHVFARLDGRAGHVPYDPASCRRPRQDIFQIVDLAPSGLRGPYR